MGERWWGEDKREVGRRMQTWQGCASRLTLETGGGGGGKQSGGMLQCLWLSAASPGWLQAWRHEPKGKRISP